MKCLVLFILLFSQIAWAEHCTCEFNAGSPIHGKLNSSKTKLFSIKGNYHGFLTPKGALECREQCAELVFEKINSNLLKSELKLLSEKMVSENSIGYNCTGITTFKFPVEMRAYIGSKSLGPTYRSMEIVHIEKQCF